MGGHSLWLVLWCTLLHQLTFLVLIILLKLNFLKNIKINLQKIAVILPIHLQANFQDLVYGEQHILLFVNVSPTPKSAFQNKLTYLFY